MLQANLNIGGNYSNPKKCQISEMNSDYNRIIIFSYC